MSSRIDEFLARYEPGIAETFRVCRGKLHELVPRGYELIYANYNALVCSFSPSDRASASILSIAAYPRWVTLFFLKGAALSDPDGLLQGTGTHVRSIRLGGAADLDRPRVRALIDRALAPYADAFAAGPKTKSVIKSVSAKQRPRRPSSRRGRADSGGDHV